MNLIRTLFVAPILAASLGSVSAQTIIGAGNFVSTGSNQPLDGTSLGLSTNSPGGLWVWGAGWSWAAPQVNATWLGGVQNAAYLAEENTVASLTLGSSGGYTKPVEFTITSSIILSGQMSNNVGLLGFWSVQPTQSNGASSLTNFTGFTFDETGTLRLYSGGTDTGLSASLGTVSEDVYYTLSYTVNTVTGGVSGITFGGNAVSGFSTTAFTDSATSYVGVASGGHSRVGFSELTVAAVVPEPGATSMILLGGIGLVLHLRRVRRSA